LPPVLLGIAPLPLFIRDEGVAVPSGEEQRVTEVVVAEDELRVDRDDAPERGLRLDEAPQLAGNDADIVEDGEAERVVRECLSERRERRRRLAKLTERCAEVAERGREGRHEVGGALKRVACAGQVVVHQRQLAALVEHRFPFRCESGGAVQRLACAGAVTGLAAGARERETGDLALGVARNCLAAQTETGGGVA
jgi:hypothetical protein